MIVGQLLRYFHTVRHLRPAQLYGRVWRRVYRPRADRRPAPPPRSFGRTMAAGADRAPTMLAADTFRFLNVTRQLTAAADWNAPVPSRLWLYNLHYFDDLNATGAESRQPWHAAVVQRWHREVPIGRGAAWEPYPTSLRIVNWVRWALRDGVNNTPDLRDSLAVQARWLAGRLEIALLGNHLWANAKALAFAGAFFSGAEADAWLAKGTALLNRELDEQVLPDGGHFERSPMYHALVLEDVLDLLNLASAVDPPMNAAFVARLRDRARVMLRWLRVMTHPDGGIALLNDAAFGIAPDYAALSAYARRVGVPVDDSALRPMEVLRDSGYARLQLGRAVLICDVAPVGPDYQPGHAHADTLTFELSVDGRRVIVDTGTSTYDAGPERERQRGTAAHNTVRVDGRNSSDVWASFRVAQRARASGLRSGEEGSTLWLEGAHDGYRPAIHRRRWQLSADSLRIDDHLVGAVRDARASLHLHPHVGVAAASGGYSLASGDRAMSLSFETAGDTTLEETTWHPEFGQSVPARAVRASFSGDRLTTRVTW